MHAGTHRWLDIGLPFSFQPSEFAKIFSIIALSRYLSDHNLKMKRFKSVFWPIIIVLIPALIVLIQPDLGSVAIICLLVIGILFYAGISFSQLLLLILLITLVGYLGITSSAYRMARVIAFTDPFAVEVVRDAGWQLSNSLISIGQGGWFGVGLGNSFQKSFFLPEAHTDFIFAILVEELGIIGGIILIFIFIIMFIGLISISFDSFKKKRYFQSYTVFGIFLLISIQVIFNIAVSIGLLGIVLRINNENKII